KPKAGHEAEGPIIDAAERDDVVSGQDDVDDLLSSLGF
ncbi:MAG: protein phosphatase CheZ, partial [Pararheinheimera sp.]|nr:protein phosphatase CheZ [Rheinheimera sp.]